MSERRLPHELASFLKLVLKAKKAVFITEAEEEYDLTKSFRKEFAGLIAYELPPLDEDRPEEEELEAVVDELRHSFLDQPVRATEPCGTVSHYRGTADSDRSGVVSKAGLLFWATFVTVVLVIITLVAINSHIVPEPSRRRFIAVSRIGIPVFYLIALVVIRLF